ncbi:NAD(P)/FAD-dependent oxidoreductase [Labilibacter marinus]|uniref:NAD(P)/FAD-dependent oxidoreductase n=1 Tax=Labilibacter marinus TaxID=1477105 RepID=UPI00082B2DB3|nr:FAD/NAD(P)-binding oxidoreductase [Labilibacter marinus]
MSTIESKDKRCVVVGASQAGVTFAFALRSEGWEGEIILLDSDTNLPYYRPPLSKAVLTGAESIDDHILKPLSLYERENISLKLGCTVKSINKADKKIILRDDSSISYDKLVLATGSRPIIPKIKNIDETPKLYTLRTAEDVKKISSALANSKQKRVVLIGGGYVGLETAASLKKLGASVTVLEKEDRVLARVTAPEMSQYFESLHTENGVNIHTNKNVNAFEVNNESTSVVCQDGSTFEADIVIIGVGVFVNKELAEAAGLEISNGIKVDSSTKTSDDSIYAIGDCTNHYNALYDRHIRLESIQNANDQAKVAAAVICGKEANYNALPWFWSDQFDVKLQMVGLYKGANEVLIRDDDGENHKFSVWYFKDDTLLAVDAVNNTKAYVMGTKFIKGGNKINKAHLVDTSVDFKPANILAKD